MTSLVNINGYSAGLPGAQLNKAKGIDQAKLFPCGSSSTIPIFDEDQDVFYIKTTDALGNVTSIREFEYKEKVILPPLDNRYVTVDQLNQFKNDIIGEIRNVKRVQQSNESGKQHKSNKPNKPNDISDSSGKQSTGDVQQLGTVQSGS